MSSKLVFLSITCLAVSYVVRSKKKSNGLHTSFAVCPKSYSVMIFVTKCLSSPSSSYLPSRSFLPPSTLQLFPSCPHSLLILLSSPFFSSSFLYTSPSPLCSSSSLLFNLSSPISSSPFILTYTHSFLLSSTLPFPPPLPSSLLSKNLGPQKFGTIQYNLLPLIHQQIPLS